MRRKLPKALITAMIWPNWDKDLAMTLYNGYKSEMSNFVLGFEKGKGVAGDRNQGQKPQGTIGKPVSGFKIHPPIPA